MRLDPSAFFVALSASSLVAQAFKDVYTWEFEHRRPLRLDSLGRLDRALNLSRRDLWPRKPVVDVNGVTIPDYDVVYTFDQRIDHANPSRGTFKQRFYHTWEHYRPGGPIYLFTPGEAPLERGYDRIFTNWTTVGVLAAATQGAIVVLEHRFYGLSNPTSNFNVKSMRLHTIDQALDDFVYFAQNFDKVGSGMPGGSGEGILPHRTPWVFVGGSYPGALAAWIMEKRPGVFWASYVSSGIVQPQLDFHQYYHAAETHMPANCSSDMRTIIRHIDGLIDDNARRFDLARIKSRLGLPNTRNLDFVRALRALPIGDWQSLDNNPRVSERSEFYKFCDALETRGDGIVSSSPEGWGLEIALDNLERYVVGPEGYFAKLCEDAGGWATSLSACFAVSGTRLGRDASVGNLALAWTWTLCNEAGWEQIGPSSGGGIVSKHFDIQSSAKFCYEAFPGAFPNPSVEEYQARVDKTLRKFSGFATYAKRVFVVNGRRDTWLPVTLSSPLVPASLSSSPDFNSTDRPIYLTDGFHCSDLLQDNMKHEPSLQRVSDEAVRTFRRWVEEFEPLDAPVEVVVGSMVNGAPGRGVQVVSVLGLALAMLVMML